jgi:hypothetical protein
MTDTRPAAAPVVDDRRRARGPRLAGLVPWTLSIAVGVVGVVWLAPVAWVGAGLIAGVSLSGSV